MSEDIKFNYAWKWFELHAKQRTTMFNFFLVFTGIIASGIFALLKQPTQAIPAATASIFGLVVSIGFIIVEFRNKALVDYGEAVLLHLEKSEIFTPDVKTKDGKILGLLRREDNDDGLRVCCQHKFWIPAIQFCFCIGFIALAWYSICQK